MPAISDDQLVALKATLVRDFVPHLPPLLKPSSVAIKNDEKNTARALAGFAIAKLCGIEPAQAAAAVVDDGDDYGIDAIYYHAPEDALFIVQAKLKASSFVQDDALAFCQGLKKIIGQDFSGFNENIKKRQVELEDAISNSSHIIPVVIYTGPGLVSHAVTALADCLIEEQEEDDRVASSIRTFGPDDIVESLRQAQAYKQVDAKITLKPWRYHDSPRQTYFGFVALSDLAKLFQQHGLALFAKNIRNPLGYQTDVAKAVRDTLASNPSDFVYLNNGVTALCQSIAPKENSKKTGKHLNIAGLSVINGAQTISSAAHFIDANPNADISSAYVMTTLIKESSDSEFRKSVTRARNHQNAVSLQNFAALDDEQERLRRDLASLGLHYAYKVDDMNGGQDPNHIRITEAARALAIAQRDPRFVVWLKKEPGQLLNTNQPAYKELFTTQLTSFRLANAVRILRYVETQMINVEKAAGSPERLAYRHGVAALGFVLTKRLDKVMSNVALLDDEKLKSELGAPFDFLRETLWSQVSNHARSALTIFRTQSYTLPFLERMMVTAYQVPSDERLAAERARDDAAAGYPKALFDYLAASAPQIGNLK